ncbi:MAG TPA: MFS transporter [Acidimicrobiales bacterium]|nr:MFS transporter [Acidimicrobiales bacterium]
MGTEPAPTMTSDRLAGAPTVAAPGNEEPRRADPKWWTLAAVCLGTFMLLLDVTIVIVALPSIQTSLHSTFTDLQWVVDAYALTLAALLLTSGSLADLYGRRLLWLVGLAIFTLASALCGAAQSTLMLQISRGVQGVGGAIMFSVSLALLANAFHGKDRGVAFAIWGAITGVAVAVGPIVGGALVTGLSWRYIFYVNLPVGIVAGALSLTRILESRAPVARRPDWPGFVLFTGALACLVYALIESGFAGFGAGQVIGCFVAAGVLLVSFLVVEGRGKHAMFDLALFRLPTFSGGAIAAFGVSATIFSMFLYLVLYIQDVLGYSALQTGLRLLLVSGGVLAVSSITGRLTSHVPIRILIGPGLVMVGLGLLWMRGLDASSSWTHLIGGLVLSGVGVGFINPPLASTAVGVVQPQRAGMASGINSTFRQVGIATGIALLGTLFANRLGSAVAGATAHTPLASRSRAITSGLENGQVTQLFHSVPRGDSGVLDEVLRGSFTTALNEILLVSGIVAIVCGVLAFLLIRQKDFVPSGPGAAGAGAGH